MVRSEKSVEVRDLEPPPKPSTSDCRSAAKYIAKACAQMGEYTQAIAWLDRASRDYPHWCGTCAESRHLESTVMKAIWKAASRRPYEAATNALGRIAQGNPKLPRGEMIRDSREWLLPLAESESQLTLGEYLWRGGDKERAVRFWRLAAHGEGDASAIARRWLAEANVAEEMRAS